MEISILGVNWVIELLVVIVKQFVIYRLDLANKRIESSFFNQETIHTNMYLTNNKNKKQFALRSIRDIKAALSQNIKQEMLVISATWG